MKFAIIGTSLISEMFMNALNHLDEHHVTVVCSRALKNAQDFAQKHNIEHAVDQYQDILNYDVDAIYIATPNSMHKEQTLHFLKQHIPVLCEKPLAANIDEVEEIIQTAIEHKTLVMEGIIPLYTENFETLRNRLDDIQPIRKATLTMNQYSSRYDAYKDGTILRAFDSNYATGSMMDIGIYPLYNAVALFGTPQGIFANCVTLDNGIDGAGTIFLIYDDKEVIVNHSKINNTVVESEILGETGNITINNMARPDHITLTTDKAESETISTPFAYNPMVYEIKDFIKSVENKLSEPYCVPYQLTMDVHTILTEAREQCHITFPNDKKSEQ